jgi:hypothetical protein
MSASPEITPEQAFDLVNQLIPAAQHQVMVAYLTGAALAALIFSGICQIFGLRRLAAASAAVTGICIVITVPTLLARVTGAAAAIFAMATVWRETLNRKHS